MSREHAVNPKSPADPAHRTPAVVSRLDPRVQGQRAAVRSILRGASVQPKLTIGAPDDEHEREADRLADEVMRMPDQPAASAGPPTAASTTRVQRMCAECDDELRRAPDGTQEEGAAHRAGVTAPGDGVGTPAVQASEAIRGLRGAGQPLPGDVRGFFEPRFAADFSQVRVHTDPRAHRAAASIGARAFTLGHDVAFRSGQYSPGSLAGRRLIAHELTHVIQQGAAAGGAVRASDPRPSPSPRHDRTVQRQPEQEAADEPVLTRPEEIALSRSSPGQFTGESQPLALSLFNFGIDVAQPKAEHRAVLAELGSLVDEIAVAPTIVRVIGFSDSTGSTPYNLRLSRRRADAVKADLEPLISQRVSISAYGETNPVASNETVTGRSRNRRVDIRFATARPPPRHIPPRPRPVPPGQRPPPPGPPPRRPPPGGGGGEEERDLCERHPLLCGIGVTPFFLPLICVIAPELCIGATCVLAPELCLIPPPPPPGGEPPGEQPPREDHGRPIVVFTPDVRAPNTPAGTNDRIGLRDSVTVRAVVTNPPAITSPITIAVDGVGANAGVATINGLPQIEITGTTALDIQGTTMSAETFAFNPYLQLAAWWGNDLVGASNRFAVSSIAQDWSVAFDGAETTRFGYGFYTSMDWSSDSGAYSDLDACRYVELVDVVRETGGMVGFGIGEVDDPDNADTADLHPTFDQHGTPHDYTKVAGSQRLKQLWRIRDMRSNSGWAPSRSSGFHIDRRFERDPTNPRCWHLVVEKEGAAVTIGGMSSGAGTGRARHVFRRINCDPPPPVPEEPVPEEPPEPEEPPPTHHEEPEEPRPCNRDELARRVDACIEQAQRSAIGCTARALSSLGGVGGIIGGIEYLRCLERMRRALLECDRRAKEDTNCPDSPPPPVVEPDEGIYYA